MCILRAVMGRIAIIDRCSYPDRDRDWVRKRGSGSGKVSHKRINRGSESGMPIQKNGSVPIITYCIIMNNLIYLIDNSN